MFGTDGKVQCVIELIRDITEETRLRDRYQASEQLAAVGRLAAGIAHEIKNPLGIILTSSQILTNPLRPGSQRAEAAEMLNLEVERLSNIVNDFLRYARPGPLSRRPSDVNELVHETIAIWSAGRRSQGERRLVEDLDPSLPRLRIDPDQMRQVILNLLINAAQATSKGGTLTIGTREIDEGGVEISFMDDGPGIPKRLLESIFEPFFTTKEEGSGLGLSIVRRIVDVHGGDVRVENVSPHGAIFRVRLPDNGDSHPPTGPDPAAPERKET